MAFPAFKKPRLLWPRALTAADNACCFAYPAAGGVHTVVIPPASYCVLGYGPPDPADDMLAALEAAMNAAHAGFMIVVDATGHVGFRNTAGSFDLLWNTSAQTRALAKILGWGSTNNPPADALNLAQNDIHYGPWQHQNGWYPNAYAKNSLGWFTDVDEASASAGDWNRHTVEFNRQETRDEVLENLPVQKILEEPDAYPHEALKTFWDDASGRNQFYWCDDAATPATSTYQSCAIRDGDWRKTFLDLSVSGGRSAGGACARAMYPKSRLFAARFPLEKRP